MLKMILSSIAKLIPDRIYESLVYRLIALRARCKSPDNGLRFLFRIDNLLYGLEGELSIKYGGGEHTKHRHMAYHEYFLDNIRDSEKVLDVGCGDGSVSYAIAKRRKADVVGMDVNEEKVSAARDKYKIANLEFINGNALKDIPSGNYDVVVLSNVLEHLPNRPEFLRNLKRSTRAAKYLIRAPMFDRDWRIPLKKELGVEWRLDDTHETEYTVESFESEIAQADMRIDDMRICWGEIWAVVKNDRE